MVVMVPAAAERPQHLRALDAANATRLARASLKRHLATAPGRAAALERCADVVLEVPEEAGGMTLGQLLCACHNVGPAHARLLLSRTRPPMSETLRLEHLTCKRALELATVLRGAAG